MTSLVGHAAAQLAFLSALRSGTLHHAWLLAGPEGVGKATFAHAAALRLLAEASGGPELPPGLDVPANHPTRSLAEAGSHPDLRVLTRLTKTSDTGAETVARSITIDQVRGLLPMFATTPSLGARRVVVIDAIDDLERAGANALLKSLEEPPAGTVFLLVSHAPGRLLPTIRSRCRTVRFSPLPEAEVRQVLRSALPEAGEEELAATARAGEGAPGRALRFAGLDVAGLDAAIERLMRQGDPSNAERVKLAQALSGKSAQARYEAFLDRAPAAIAAEARTRTGPALRAALDAHRDARDLAGSALGLSLDAQATVFEMGTILARLASPA
ncbi:DNA polymerase III subunit delta' [Sphingomonas lenta]|uniref:DNA polymerase III subunit delta n=1 Tax=Sphingomonas lenta TaxID=1141887 RepID=A0A2A2SK44_9SPHN|nr:DNA polymerase III subunit delta' [Sphingomonas lenta]PAX09588.1 DNA polymerase III subunit delta' [Sphingomonas lenta]